MDHRAVRIRGFRFLFGLCVASCWSLFCLWDASSAKPSQSSQEASALQFAGMDHEHSAGAVEAMTPHQRHAGPHMKWTALRPSNAGDAQRADDPLEYEEVRPLRGATRFGTRPLSIPAPLRKGA